MTFYALNFALIFTIDLNRRYVGMQPINLPVTKQQDMKHNVHAMQGLMTRQVKMIHSITYSFNNPEWPYVSIPKFLRPLQSKVTYLTGIPCHQLHILHDTDVSQHTSSNTTMLEEASSVLRP